jgi:hypothetical protein
MATRGELRDAFTSELKGVSGTYDVEDSGGSVIDSVTLDSADIGLRNPEATEALPAIVYHEDYRRVVYNGVGAGPDMKSYDSNGNVDEEIWREYIEGQFIIDVRASNETYKEPLYEALRSQFGKYQFSAWDEASLHADIIDVEVLDASSADSGDVEDVIRGDQLEVRITFYRDYTMSTDIITRVDSLIDADDDGTVDNTFTTT